MRKKPHIASLLIWSVLFSVALAGSLSETATRKPNMVVDEKARDEAEGITANAGIQGGLIVHLGCGDPSTTSTSSGQAGSGQAGTQTAALRVNERYLVHGLDRDPRKVAAARRNIQARGLYGAVSVDVWEGKTLPYSDNLVNLLIVASGEWQVTSGEIERVLAPGGVLMVKDERLSVPSTLDPRPSSLDGWQAGVKPWPKEMGEWTHHRGGPGSNPVAPDTLVGPPRGLQWSCKPLWSRSHAFTSSFNAMVSAQGRVFYILDEAPTGIAQDAVPEQWTLIARDAFNGVLLWKQPLCPWGVKAWKKLGLRVAPLPSTDCLVAHKDRVMITLGYQSAVSILDAATGRKLGVCEGSDGALELRCENDTLVVNRAGETLMAFDTRDARPLWKVDTRIFNMVINSERVIYFDQALKALVCLRLADGTSEWQNPAVRPKSIMSHGDYVVLGPDLQVLSVDTGNVLWTKKGKMSKGVFVAQGQIWTISQNDKHVTSFDLATGEERTVIDTGDFYSAGHHPRCHASKASENYLITANRGSEFIINLATLKAGV